MIPESRWSVRLTAVIAAVVALWTRWVIRRDTPIQEQKSVEIAMPLGSRLSDRRLAIRRFTVVMHEQWATGNIGMARFVEKRITALENMSDAEFNHDYEDKTT